MDVIAERHGCATVYLTPIGRDQAYITAAVNTSCDAARVAADLYEQVARLLLDRGLSIVHERVFGSLEVHSVVLEARGRRLADSGIDPDSPVTYVQGQPWWGRGLAGASILGARATSPADVWTIRDEAGRPCGRGWQCHGARFLVLQNLHGRQPDRPGDDSQPAQAARMFDRAQQLLLSQRLSYRHVARTWLYLSDILGWYGAFNQVRSAKYDSFGLMPKPSELAAGDGQIRLPASTGIQGDAPTGAATTMDLLAAAIEPGSPVTIRQMSNPRQKDAFRYGSAFSRGACISLPGAAWILVSGTAAIDERGASLMPGDVRGQIHKTLDIIEALIQQEGAGLDNLCDATVFLKRPEDADSYRQVASERRLTDLPGVCVVADVCRDELLFEMDAAAVVPRRQS